MPNLNALSSATIAMNAARTLTRELEQRILMPAVGAVSDGRKQRWEQHKQDRRAELTSGTIEAIRALGADTGMDEIAGHIGVSKTVLYRYFADKNDLTAAVTVRYMESTLLPKLTESMSDDLVDYDLVRTMIGQYVEIVTDDPNLYLFTTGRTASSPGIAHTERIFTEAVATTLQARLAARGAKTTGARTWAATIVGGIIRAVDTAMACGENTSVELIDELTMLVWSGLVGIVTFNGDPSAFASNPPQVPDISDRS